MRAIEPHTEFDPVALLTQFLVVFGKVVGRVPHFRAEADKHSVNLFTVQVGNSSKGRKGTSYGHIGRIFKTVAPESSAARPSSGLSSGEGLIRAVRNATAKEQANNEKEGAKAQGADSDNAGVVDKRLQVVEPEFASTLRVLRREGNTLSALMRQAWDTGDLQTLTNTNPLKTTGSHISIIGHITKHELLRNLTDIEMGNGFANRFLWICVRRSKYLPFGGRISDVDFAPLNLRLKAAIEFSKSIGEICRDEEAHVLWGKVYYELSEGKPGLLDAVTACAEAQVMRLACIYALLNCSAIIRRDHLLAALALWTYAEASAAYIFGDSSGNPIAERIYEALDNAPDGLTQTEIDTLFSKNCSAADKQAALASLRQAGRADSRKRESGRGRPAVVWFAKAEVATSTIQRLLLEATPDHVLSSETKSCEEGEQHGRNERNGEKYSCCTDFSRFFRFFRAVHLLRLVPYRIHPVRTHAMAVPKPRCRKRT